MEKEKNLETFKRSSAKLYDPCPCECGWPVPGQSMTTGVQTQSPQASSSLLFIWSCFTEVPAQPAHDGLDLHHTVPLGHTLITIFAPMGVYDISESS